MVSEAASGSHLQLPLVISLPEPFYCAYAWVLFLREGSESVIALQWHLKRLRAASCITGAFWVPVYGHAVLIVSGASLDGGRADN